MIIVLEFKLKVVLRQSKLATGGYCSLGKIQLNPHTFGKTSIIEVHGM
jgi:hypothetical protein